MTLILGLSLQSKAQGVKHSDNWSVVGIYSVDSKNDTVYAIEAGFDTTKSLVTQWPTPFRTDLDYMVYILWVDTLGNYFLDSIEAPIPDVPKMELLEVDYD